MLTAAIVLFLATQPVHSASVNPTAACEDAKDKALCAEILPMVDSVDPHASLGQLRILIANHGWPTVELVGQAASNVARGLIERVAAEQPCSAQEKPAADPKEKHWIPGDPKVDCAGVSDPALCSALLVIRDRDQLARYDELNHPGSAASEAVAQTDRANLALVEAILAARGWPGVALVGRKGSGAVWTVIQHADLGTQEKYLELMTKAAAAGDLSPALLATTVDRIRVREGKPQVYGSQFETVDGELRPYVIEDPAHVDERRAAVGLQPLAEYAATLREMHSKKK